MHDPELLRAEERAALGIDVPDDATPSPELVARLQEAKAQVRDLEQRQAAARSQGWPAIQPESPVTEPCIAVPEGFQGSEAEAIALAVAGAIQAIALERDSWRSYLLSTKARLRALVEAYPQTSFAASESAKEDAMKWLTFLDALEPEQKT